MESGSKKEQQKVKQVQNITTYSTAIANCFSTDAGGMGSLVAAVRPSTEGIASEAYSNVFNHITKSTHLYN